MESGPTVVVNPALKAAYYAVRGAITNRAQDIATDIKEGKKKYPFDNVIFCNIGNPQALEQKPMTYYRNVLSLFDSPYLLNHPEVEKLFKKDVIARAKSMVVEVGGPTATGAYSWSAGHPFVRKNAAKFITERDRRLSGNPSLPESNSEHIFLTDGASSAVKNVFTVLLAPGGKDSVLIPVPQYPLYSALLTLIGSNIAPYYLDEERGWGMTMEEVERCYAESVAKGYAPKAIVVINPGNPTGQVLDKEMIVDIVKFAHRRKVVIMADEVYQENIYAPGKQFHSFRSVVLGMGEPYRTGTLLVSFHSTSKGVIGECGKRGGYAECVNWPAEALSELLKLQGFCLCSNITGQVTMDLMVRGPQPGEESYELHQQEHKELMDSLKERALLLVDHINKIPGMRTNPVEGALYAFVELLLPKKFLEEREAINRESPNEKPTAPDAVWCMRLLEATGIVVVPGSGFGQKAGTHHFRTTILPPKNQLEAVVSRLAEFQKKFMAEYA